MKQIKSNKPYWKMNTEELARATKEFDRPIPRHKLKPLSSRERGQWERAKRKPSRSVYVLNSEDAGNEAMFLRLDADLIRRSHQCAKSHNMTWEQLIEKGLLSALTILEKTSASTIRKSS